MLQRTSTSSHSRATAHLLTLSTRSNSVDWVSPRPAVFFFLRRLFFFSRPSAASEASWEWRRIRHDTCTTLGTHCGRAKMRRVGVSLSHTHLLFSSLVRRSLPTPVASGVGCARRDMLELAYGQRTVASRGRGIRWADDACLLSFFFPPASPFFSLRSTRNHQRCLAASSARLSRRTSRVPSLRTVAAGWNTRRSLGCRLP